MDYSLFLIVLEVPQFEDQEHSQKENQSFTISDAKNNNRFTVINFEDPEKRQKD